MAKPASKARKTGKTKTKAAHPVELVKDVDDSADAFLTEVRQRDPEKEDVRVSRAAGLTF